MILQITFVALSLLDECSEAQVTPYLGIERNRNIGTPSLVSLK